MSNQLYLLNIFKSNFRYIDILDLLIKQRIMTTAVQLKPPHRKEKFGRDNCILCGKSEKVVTTPSGRAIAREDSNILHRIRSLDVDDLSYHIDNKSFKSYDLKKVIDRVVRVRFSSCPFCP